MSKYDDFYAEVSEEDGFNSMIYKDVCKTMNETKNFVKRGVGRSGGSIGKGALLSIVLKTVYERYGLDGLKIMAHRMVLGYIYKYLFNEKKFVAAKTAGKVFHGTEGISLSQRNEMIGKVLKGKSFNDVYAGQKYKELKLKLDAIVRSKGLTGLYQALKDREMEDSVREVFGEKIIEKMDKWNTVHTASSKSKKKDIIDSIISMNIGLS